MYKLFKKQDGGLQAGVGGPKKKSWSFALKGNIPQKIIFIVDVNGVNY